MSGNAAQAGKGPTRRQGPGKASETVRNFKKSARELDPNKGKRRGGFHKSASKPGYERKPKYPGKSEGEELTDIDETYRGVGYPMASVLDWSINMKPVVASLDWSTHKSETFNDPGEKGGHPAWGMKSIIDRGVKPHEKSKGDKRIGEAENQVTKRDVKGKKFKAYSMMEAFVW